MKSQKLTFPNHKGQQLSARLDFPVDQHPKAFAIFAHCFTCNKNLTAVKNISQSLSNKGYAVLLFDFTGLGNSEGEFEETSFTSNLQDLNSAADFLKTNYKAPSILIGHSLGGAAALFAAGSIPSIKAIASIAAPFDPHHVTKLLGDDLAEIENRGHAEVNIGGRPFTINKEFIRDLEKRNAETVAKELRKPLLILHSPQDTIVSIKNAAKMYSAAHHPKSFISLDGADHLLSEKQDSQYAGKMIASWVEKYLDLPEETPIKGSSKVISKTGNEAFTTEIKAGRHYLTADEPEEVGGLDFGPTPYDLVAAGLAACTSMTLQMYAKRKNWNLEDVKVHVEHNKIHANDCETCEKSTQKIDVFYRKIEFDGNLSNQERTRLLEIADKCPVHKTLQGTVQIETELL